MSWPQYKMCTHEIKVIFTNFIYFNKMSINSVYNEAWWTSIKQLDLPWISRYDVSSYKLLFGKETVHIFYLIKLGIFIKKVKSHRTSKDLAKKWSKEIEAKYKFEVCIRCLVKEKRKNYTLPPPPPPCHQYIILLPSFYYTKVF